MGTLHDVTYRIWERQLVAAWQQGTLALAPEGVNLVEWRHVARVVARRYGYTVRTFVIPLPDAPHQAAARVLSGAESARAAHPAGKNRQRGSV